MQARHQSLLEAVSNTALAGGINFTANLIVLPLIGFEVTISQNLFLCFVFTVISITRNYVVRRIFDRKE